MPVTFTRRVIGEIDPEAFTVTTRSGKKMHPGFATTKRANEASQRHTVLLIGEFGNEPEDPPIEVEVTGHLELEGGDDARGLSVQVTPVKSGPSLVLAFSAIPGQIESDCPPETKQIIVVTWAGGVRPVNGITTDTHRSGYTITTTEGEIHPIVLGNLGDGDNYEHLYLDTTATPLRVSMKAGLVMDPRDDPNPLPTIEIAVVEVTRTVPLE